MTDDLVELVKSAIARPLGFKPGQIVNGLDAAAQAAIAECFRWRDIKDAPSKPGGVVRFTIGDFYIDVPSHPTHFMPLPKGPEGER